MTRGVRRLLGPLLLALLAAAAGVAPAAAGAASYAGAPAVVDGLRVPARAGAGTVDLATSGGAFAPRFWPGVNLGSTTPGHQPGELAATRADYDRWLAGMHALGARVVRVYTIHPPAFYAALAALNAEHPASPLRLVQGTWIPEEEALAARDLYAPAVVAGFERELRDAVAVVHGDADLPRRPGHAHGRYRTDVSRWTLAWSPGVEWDPGLVQATDRAHAGAPPHAGRFVSSTPGATPTETWLAARLDALAALEARRGWSRPLTFTNWLTTDPLAHPDEPFDGEDLVGIDANHVVATPAWPAGTFASYHAYPYYPDFTGLEPGLLAHRRRDGRVDPFAGLLARLRAHHGAQPVMVTELGVPTGPGIAHRGPLGRGHGGHTETAAGRIVADLVAGAREEGMAGAVVFQYVDEWFKKTWNVLAVEQPAERRALWTNVLGAEEHFGLVAAEPGPRGGPPLRRLAGGLRVGHDEGALVVRVPAGARTVALDVRPGGPDASGADVVLTLAGARARVARDAALDPVAALEAVPAQTGFAAPRLLVARAHARRDGTAVPADTVAVDTLPAVRRGTAREVRIPWALLSYADPSSRRLWAFGPDRSVTTIAGGRVTVTAGAARGTYRWAGWNRVRSHERRKAGWGAVARAFARSVR